MIRFSSVHAFEPWIGRLAFTSALLLAFACNDRRPPPQSGRFDRPNRVAFACVVDDELRRLGDCAVDDPDHDEKMFALVTQSARGEVAAVDLNYDRGRGRILDARRDIPGFTFTPVGELPSGIQVAANHPGVTYVANFASRDVYVVNTAALLSLTDREAPILQIVSLDVGNAGDAGVPADAGAAIDAGVAKRHGAGPVAMRLTPDEDALVLVMPDQGEVVWLPIERCERASDGKCSDGRLRTAEMRFVDLRASSDLLTTTVQTAVEDDPYELTCSLEHDAPTPSDSIEVAPEDFEMRSPRPVALAFDSFCGDADPCTRQVVIADESLPVLHRLDLDALGDPARDPILPPITVGAPTLDVVVTPNVPKSLGSDEAVKYIYAIDAGDGSVLVVQDGRVLDVNSDPDKPSNRLPLERRGRGVAVAKRLEILTPVFDPQGPVDQYVEETRKKTSDAVPLELDDLLCVDPEHDRLDLDRLRGVFLAVATNDGHVHVVDVHDMELPHGADTGCLERRCSFEPDLPRLIRHHPRLSQRLFDLTDPSLTPEKETLFFVVEGVAYSVRDDGSTGTPNAPGLDCMTCTDALVQVVPDPEDVAAAEPEREPEAMDDDAGVAEPGQVADAGATMDDQVVRACPGDTPALVCSREDPWLDLNQLWVAQYEGLLAGSQGGHGHLADDKPAIFEGEVDFCLAGVLGDRDMPEVTTSAGETRRPPGDQLIISSPVLDETLLGMLDTSIDPADLRACAELAEALDDEDAPRIAFPIKRAFRDRLEIGLQLIDPVGGAKTYGDIARCMGGQTPTADRDEDAPPYAGGLPLRFHVRLRNAYRVIGSEDGYANNVIADETDEHCRIDPNADPLANGRAFPGVRFTNRLIEFQPHEPGPDEREPGRDVELRLRVVSRARQLSTDLTTTGFSSFAVIPEDLLYNPVDRRLYLVDINSRGLVPIQLDPFPEIVGATFN